MKKLILVNFAILMLTLNTPVFASKENDIEWPKETHQFGVSAADINLQSYASHIVKQYPLCVVEEGEILTLNKMGAIDPNTGIFAQKFIEYARTISQSVLSVGETGNIAWDALEKGITIVANDLEPRHLAHLYAKVPEERYESLYLKAGKFPDEVHFPDESFGAIYFGRVLHFMTRDEIDNSFKESYRILAQGGKIFARSSSPYQKHLQQFFLPTFEEKLKRGEPSPGICTEMQRGWPNFYSNLPSFMNLLDVDTLKASLEKAGFSIEELNYFPLNHPEFKLDGREAIGFIAVKK